MPADWQVRTIRDCLEAEFPGEWGDAPRHDSASVAPARVGGKPWFVADVLEDEEWLRDPDTKAREKVLRFFAERDRAVDPVDPQGPKGK